MENKVILITGGVRSGKSAYGEGLFQGDQVIYLATNQFFDLEMQERIALHQKKRNPKWRLIEAYKDLGKAIEGAGEPYVFLDCVTALITNFMMETEKEHWRLHDLNALEEEIMAELGGLLEVVFKEKKSLILITNEVGSGIVPESPLGRSFRDLAGSVNKRLAEAADEVILMVSGIPVRIKEARSD
jgi:adenosylcobinamide kinase/adenosylcobinamide-phosphate guanylyltransferase